MRTISAVWNAAHLQKDYIVSLKLDKFVINQEVWHFKYLLRYILFRVFCLRIRINKVIFLPITVIPFLFRKQLTLSFIKPKTSRWLQNHYINAVWKNHLVQIHQRNMQRMTSPYFSAFYISVKASNVTQHSDLRTNECNEGFWESGERKTTVFWSKNNW